MSIYQSIQDFISLALQNGTIEPLDELYHRNQLLHFLGLNDWAEVDKEAHEKDSLILMDQLLAIANENNVIEKGQDELHHAQVKSIKISGKNIRLLQMQQLNIFMNWHSK